MDCALKSQAGASLVEITIGIVIIITTALIIITFSRNTIFVSQYSRETDAAYLTAEQKITELMSHTFPSSTGSDTAIIDSIKFTRTWNITDTNFIKRATISVGWNSLKGYQEIQLTGALK